MNRIYNTNQVIYGLTYHHIGVNVLANYPDSKAMDTIAKCLNFLESHFQISGKDLIVNVDKTIEIPDIAKVLSLAVEKQLNEASTNKVSLSITGGFDSRILLSILLKLGVEIHGYTYGNPQARDCLIAKDIAQQCRIPYALHDIQFDKVTFRKAAEESIKVGDYVCSLHRAHRLEAIKRESDFADTMFLGTMGGEFVKGANHEDYIVSNFVFEYAQKKDLDTVKKYMKLRGLKVNNNLAIAVKNVIDEQSYIKDSKNMELHALLDIAAKLHHGQNLVQYTKFFPHVFTPYCYPEYMRLLFRSKYSFLYRRKTQNPRKYKLENPRFGSLMQQHLNPELAKIPYSNGFSASEYLLSPYWAALKAKQRKRKLKTPPTFPLGKWMEEYVKEMLQEIIDTGSSVCGVYDIPLLQKELDLANLPQTEPFWLKYTCPIQIYLTEKLIGEIS